MYYLKVKVTVSDDINTSNDNSSLEPFRRQVEQSGMSDQELDNFLEDLIQKRRTEM